MREKDRRKEERKRGSVLVVISGDVEQTIESVQLCVFSQ